MKLPNLFCHVLVGSLLVLTTSACSGSSEPETIAVPGTETPTGGVDKSTAAEQMKSDIPEEVKKLLAKNTCLGCHKLDKKLVGPSYLEVAERGYTKEELIALIRQPKPEHWPDYPPMAPMEWVAGEDLEVIAGWLAELTPEN